MWLPIVFLFSLVFHHSSAQSVVNVASNVIRNSTTGTYYTIQSSSRPGEYLKLSTSTNLLTWKPSKQVVFDVDSYPLWIEENSQYEEPAMIILPTNLVRIYFVARDNQNDGHKAISVAFTDLIESNKPYSSIGRPLIRGGNLDYTGPTVVLPSSGTSKFPLLLFVARNGSSSTSPSTTTDWTTSTWWTSSTWSTTTNWPSTESSSTESSSTESSSTESSSTESSSTESSSTDWTSPTTQSPVVCSSVRGAYLSADGLELETPLPEIIFSSTECQISQLWAFHRNNHYYILYSEDNLNTLKVKRGSDLLKGHEDHPHKIILPRNRMTKNEIMDSMTWGDDQWPYFM